MNDWEVEIPLVMVYFGSQTFLSYYAICYNVVVKKSIKYIFLVISNIISVN